MLLITGTARPRPDARERLIVEALAIAEATKHDDGCLAYTFAAALDSDDIVSIELWRDRAALEAHMAHEHTQRFLAALDGAFDEAPAMHETEL